MATSIYRHRYPYIVAWCRHLGSYDYYIDREVNAAAADGAPSDVIYKAHNSEQWIAWHPQTMPHDTLLGMARQLDRLGIPVYPEYL